MVSYDGAPGQAMIIGSKLIIFACRSDVYWLFFASGILFLIINLALVQVHGKRHRVR